MAQIISIETSTKVCSVALHSSGELISFSQYFLEKSHSSILMPLIDETIRHSGIEISELDAVAISEGPGSYTGLRIGTSTAKGLCFGLDIPLIAINTLLSMAHGACKSIINPDLLCPMLDARRMEVYCMIVDDQLRIIQEIEPTIIDENSYGNILDDHSILFFGNGSSKCKPFIKKSGATFMDDIHPSAKEIGDLAWIKYEQNDFVDLVSFEPFYLKAFKPGKPKQLI